MTAPIRNYFAWFYFSLRGRIGRQAYWVFMVIPAFLIGVLFGFVHYFISDRALLVLIVLLAPLLAWSGIAVSVKRLHDIGKSGWWVLLGFIPFLSYVITIVLGFIRGKVGDNRFGRDPHGAKPALL